MPLGKSTDSGKPLQWGIKMSNWAIDVIQCRNKAVQGRVSKEGIKDRGTHSPRLATCMSNSWPQSTSLIYDSMYVQ